MTLQLADHLRHRVLPFEGVFNFRDMGGYEAADGRKVKYGILFRSAELTGMTEQDLSLLQSLGIRTIFDYRDDGEAALKPDPVIPGINNIRVPAMRQEVPADMRELIRGNFFKKLTAESFAAMYVQMAIDNPSFQRLMSMIMNPDNLGILHHCAAGRDRTGIGAAFILLALGVPRETIIEDYLLSNQTLHPMNENMKEQLAEVMPPEEAAEVIAKLKLRRDSWRPCSPRSTRTTEAPNRFWSANLA
ncbi:hypothetical protein J6TS7_22560 [Paenibacillus dendritiformis]|nr:tyrosine-protein phosphatase [Bacillus cereus]GIO78646.1 hypothetical protein J6TS7_22560 [Paenibacillus dendritiformis]